ncbi:anaphase-promoting complex subunit 15-like [Pomacea canaliculata]|uniref:anaphase-promoting complex subunit 15-like n=1 Tax=Pomacea canaliculata TaxID=400727 RepID=UPI000D72E9E3|nr:anaphase-promoting complex subunit 15-like [Pomacea canaliculata]
MAGPMMPSLAPRVIDPLWFTVDKPCDDAELQSKLESEYHQWLHNVGSKDAHLIPIGKTLEQMDEDDEEDEDDGEEDDEESDTNDDELDTDLMDDRDSADDASNY